MVLQNIIFPKKSICDKSILYYRQEKGNITNFNSEILLVKKGGVCSFFTYFNGFSLVKWQEYTNISDFQLHICLKGKGKVYLCHSKLRNETEIEKIIEKNFFDTTSNGQAVNLVFNIPEDICGGIVFFKLEADEEVTFYSGSYQTSQEMVNKVHIAIGICTYRREKYINRTLKLLSNEFLHKTKSPLYGNLKIYVSDNGKTLDCNMISEEFVMCIHNKNAGGTGGFTRCMIEALREQKKRIKIY